MYFVYIVEKRNNNTRCKKNDCVYVILPKEYKNLCLFFSLLQPSRMTVY